MQLILFSLSRLCLKFGKNMMVPWIQGHFFLRGFEFRLKECVGWLLVKFGVYAHDSFWARLILRFKFPSLVQLNPVSKPNPMLLPILQHSRCCVHLKGYVSISMRTGRGHAVASVTLKRKFLPSCSHSASCILGCSFYPLFSVQVMPKFWGPTAVCRLLRDL